MKKLLFLLLFLPLVSFGQDYGNSSDAMKLCSALRTNNFGTDLEAEKGLDRILSVIGASKRFVLQPCNNINNAVATSFRGIRYILYDRSFMNSLSSGNNWGNLFILSHEVGHHVNGHSLDLVLYASDSVDPISLSENRQGELEADEFAGFIIAKLGGPLSSIVEIISKISNNDDDTYNTHPSRSKRIFAATKGYNKGFENNSIIDFKDEATDQFYLLLEQANESYSKAENAINDFEKQKYRYQSVENYQQALLIEPENLQILYNLGVISVELNQTEMAKNYYEKVLLFDKDYYDANLNLAALILSGENKIILEMNSLGVSNADYKRYDELDLERKKIYIDALKYLYKLQELNPTDQSIINTMNNIKAALKEM